MNEELPIRVHGTGWGEQIQVHGERPIYPDPPDSPLRFPAGHTTWGRPEGAHVQVSLTQAAYAQVMRHAQSGCQGGSHREVCGILLGQVFRAPDWCPDRQRYHITVERALPDQRGVSRAAFCQFTHESWAALAKEAEENFPQLRIVGWYHSHPDYGAFFSPTDRDTQRIYFSSVPWRVGLVVDPVRDEGKFFALAHRDSDVAELPGFYEQLGQGGRSVITWRNWPRVQEQPKARRPPLPPAPRVGSQLWRRAGVVAVIIWAVAAFAILLQMQASLTHIRSELRDLRAVIGATVPSTTTGTAQPSPLRDRGPTPSAPPAPAPTSTLKPIPSPTPMTYTVQSEDTLSGIASRFGVTVDAIKQLNDLQSDSIRPGQKLLIPVSPPSPVED